MEDIKNKPLPETYAAAIAELEAIVRKMQSDDCDIDLLASYTARSLALLKLCKQRLQTTDEELKKLLSALS